MISFTVSLNSFRRLQNHINIRSPPKTYTAYPVQVCCVWKRIAIVGLLNPGRNTKSMTFRMFCSTSAGRSRIKLGEYGRSLFQVLKKRTCASWDMHTWFASGPGPSRPVRLETDRMEGSQWRLVAATTQRSGKADQHEARLEIRANPVTSGRSFFQRH